MEPGTVQRIISQVAASYAKKELDRVWYDRIMATDLGANLRALSLEEQRALELIAYLTSAYIVHQDPNPTALRNFLYTVLSDIPPEISKRMTMDRQQDISSSAIDLLSSMSQEEIAKLCLEAGLETYSSNVSVNPSKLKSRIERMRKDLKSKRRFIGVLNNSDKRE